MLSVIMVNVMLSGSCISRLCRVSLLLSAPKPFMLMVIMLSVVMLTVTYAEWHIYKPLCLWPLCWLSHQSPLCLWSLCWVSLCQLSLMLSGTYTSLYAYNHYVECHYVKCHYAESQGALLFVDSRFLLIVFNSLVRPIKKEAAGAALSNSLLNLSWSRSQLQLWA
jgi:hypothetical protein